MTQLNPVLRRAAFLSFVIVSEGFLAHAQIPAVTLTPAAVVAGSPELIRVEAPGAASIDGEWLGRKLEFFRGRGGRAWFALAGVDVEAPVGPSTLNISTHTASGTANLSQTVEIHPAHYRTGTLTVAPKFVEPGPEALKQIEAEVELKQKLFAASAAEPLWSGRLSRSSDCAADGQLRHAPHLQRQARQHSQRNGFSREERNAGARRQQRSGGAGPAALLRRQCVVIDHGLGLFTLSMHLSRIDVKEGQHVEKGELIGLSGATGRVTGPHLHWAVRWQGAYLDPAKLLQAESECSALARDGLLFDLMRWHSRST